MKVIQALKPAKKIKMILSENQVKNLLENIKHKKISEKIHHPNSNGKFEFEFDNEIGKKYKKKNEIYYLLAKEQIEKFTNVFEVTDEVMVIQADKDTFIAILAGLYEEFHTASDKFNFLNPKN